MKLTNIFFFAFFVLIGMACSKDDGDPRVGTGEAAVLSISTRSVGILPTKAGDVNELPGEANINNLAVLVFDETGTELLGEPAWATTEVKDGVASILDVPCKSLKAQIVIIANVPQGTFSDVTNMSGLQSRIVQLAAQSQSNLTMSSQVIVTENALKKGDNYLGYASMGADNINGISKPVEVTRLVARVELAQVSTRFDGTKLDGCTLRLDNVHIQNRKTASHYFSTSYWGAVETAGYLDNSSVVAIGRTVTDNSPLSPSYVTYVMENESASEASTALVVTATLLTPTGTAAQTKNFTAIINDNGLEKGYNHDNVKRNFVYRLKLTFGENSFDPVTADLIVEVEVLDWGPVYQDVVVE